MRVEARDFRWQNKWVNRCNSILARMAQGDDQIAINTARQRYYQFEQEVGREKCPDHPNGCPQMPQVETLEEAYMAVDIIRQRCAFEVAKAIALN